MNTWPEGSYEKISRTGQALMVLLEIVSNSSGVAGYHLNGDIASWVEFDDVITECYEAIAEERDAKEDVG